MYKYLSNKLVQKWIQNGIIVKEDADIYTYGIEIILSSIVGALLVLTVGLLFFPQYPLVFLFIVIPLRCYCGGYHAETYFRCNMFMISSFIGTSLLSKYLPVNAFFLCAGLILFNVIMSLLAPVDNKNKRLSTEKKKNCKIISSILCMTISFVGIVLLYLNSKYTSILFYSLLTVIILLLLGIMKNRIHVD